MSRGQERVKSARCCGSSTPPRDGGACRRAVAVHKFVPQPCGRRGDSAAPSVDEPVVKTKVPPAPCTPPEGGLETCVPVSRGSGRRRRCSGPGRPLGETPVDRRTTGRPVPRYGLRVTTQVPVRGRKTTRVRRALVENGLEGLRTKRPFGPTSRAGAVTSTTAPLVPGLVDQRYAVHAEAPRPSSGGLGRTGDRSRTTAARPAAPGPGS
jgi:hypothetical protein